MNTHDVINKNDFLGGIQIYDYTHLEFTGGVYTVTTVSTGPNPVSHDVGTTSFSKIDDRLVWNAGTGEFYLAGIS